VNTDTSAKTLKRFENAFQRQQLATGTADMEDPGAQGTVTG